MLEAVRDRARPYFDDASPAHDWHHVQRVDRLAETLCERHPELADERVVRLAVYCHDVGRTKEDRGEIDDHATWGAREAERILGDCGADAATIERVQHCIRAHRYSNDVEPATLEAKLVSDADNLDALGAVGIARVFAYGGEIGDPIHDPAQSVEEDDTDAGATQYNHVHKKILDLPARMYTDVGRDLAADRAAFVREYVARFDDEVAGER
ncbi:phosphohydrolase [Natrinema saccharevitans]|uniref:Phosphohydrolase n=1 Tax=Natrinema saccharevitans TaxID=301967 RepID=A0A1S8B113_9EURY|nr:HD domain-containing protein [Natrinema saccharevitans]OLZ42294.1 phosphohydrolase [Natrinema saccharevitans]